MFFSSSGCYERIIYFYLRHAAELYLRFFAVLVAVLDTVCQFVQNQSTAKGSVWRMIMAKDIFVKLEMLRLEYDDYFQINVCMT
jgi:hypothetical protein